MYWAFTDFFPLFIWFTGPPSALHSFRGRLQNTNYKIHNITNSWVVRSWLGSSWVTVQPPGSSFLLLLPEFWPFHCWLAHSLEGGEPRERRFYLPIAFLISLRKNKVYKTNIKFQVFFQTSVNIVSQFITVLSGDLSAQKWQQQHFRYMFYVLESVPLHSDSIFQKGIFRYNSPPTVNLPTKQEIAWCSVTPVGRDRRILSNERITINI